MPSSRDTKKPVGRPATGIGVPVTVRLQPDPLTALDGYIARQPDPKPSRPEMIRKILEDRLVLDGLIEAHAPLDRQIADQKAFIAAMPNPLGPSPEAGLATMDKAVAENHLAHLKNQRAKRERGKRE